MHRKSFQLPAGVHVPNLDGIHECYQCTEISAPAGSAPQFSFLVNVSFPTLRPMLEAFCAQLDEPCFFFCELPLLENEEASLRTSDSDPFHCRVYYLDGCTRAQLQAGLATYGKWFLPDGMSRFGFASHVSRDEIYVQKYKIVQIFTRDPARYQAFLARFSIPQEAKIKTVWQTFSRQTPGACTALTVQGKTVWDIVEALREHGLYAAEVRADH